MAEQDRKLAEQERKMAEADRSKPGDGQQNSERQFEQEQRIAKLELNLSEANRSKSDESHQSSDERAAQEQRIAKLELNLAEAKKQPVPGETPGPGRMPVKKDDPVEEAEEGEVEFTGSLEELGIPIQDPGDPEDHTRRRKRTDFAMGRRRGPSDWPIVSRHCTERGCLHRHRGRGEWRCPLPDRRL